MVAGRGFDVFGAKPAGLSYMRLQVRPSGIEPGATEHPPISIGAVRGVTYRGAI
jgi:hypothetical protein